MLLTRRIRIPYTVALVIAGLAIAIIPGTPPVALTPELIVAVFLPILVFEAAYNLDFQHLRENLRPITFLAIPGVLLTASVVAALVHFLGGLSWPVAFLFGAIVSATDPVSVVATFKAIGAPSRLRTILEGESLFNDGTSIVLFNLILGVILAAHFDPLESVTEFAIVVIGGLAVGLVLGYAASWVLSRVDDYLAETVITILIAYGGFFIAEQLHVSGVIATVALGLLVGNYGSRVAFSPRTRLAVSLGWELLAFVANSLIFLLVGLQLRLANMSTALGLIALAVLAVLVSRVLVVGLAGLLLRLLPSDHALPRPWYPVLVWGGLRGALSLALALSVPAILGSGADAVARETILAMTFGVILFSLIVQGMTMGPLLRALRVANRTTELTLYESTQAELGATRAVLNSLEARSRHGELAPDLAAELREEYQAREGDLLARLRSLNIEHGALRQEALLAQRPALAQVEKSALRDLFTRGAINEETLRELSDEIDHRLEGATTSAENRVAADESA